MHDLIEVIGINPDNCLNCHQCIAVCPVKICSDGSGEVVKFNNHLCIGCGRCIEACVKSHFGVTEKSARFPIDDKEIFLDSLPKGDLVALVAPSAQANFDLPKLITGLRLLGIKAVYDVSLGAEIAVECYHQVIQSGTFNPPLIAQPCPAIVKYIELQHPTLIPHLAPVGSPVHNLAIYVKSLHPDDKLVFFSPCLAKRREFQDSQAVQFNVIFQSLQEIFKERNIDLSQLKDGDFDNIVPAGITTNFSCPGGLKQSYLHKYPETPASQITQIEGSIVFEKYFHDLERSIRKGNSDLPLIVDVLSCERGCNMGVGCINSYKSIDAIETAVISRAEASSQDKIAALNRQAFLAAIIKQLDFEYHGYQDLSHLNKLKMPNPAQLQQIYKDMHKYEDTDFRNCAACGYNSCFYMAIAVYNGLNKVENCHLYQEKELLREHKILNDMVDELEALNLQLEEQYDERKRQEQILVQNSKLAAMGEMIGMIAHQWRQPLSSISTLAGNLQVYLDLDMFDKDQFIELLTDINNHAQYLSNTINDFRHFFKPDNPRDTILLSTVIDSTLAIIGKSLEYKNVKLIQEYVFTQTILTYPNELMQVFLNILKNASDVFVDNEITVPEIIIKGYESNSYQRIEIYDNGGGIPADIMDKIFDPYFSTKGPGIGTGLRLYMSKMIIEEHCHGQLEVRNTGQGACFTITLPFLKDED